MIRMPSHMAGPARSNWVRGYLAVQLFSQRVGSDW